MEPGGLVNATKYGHAASTPQSTAAPPSRSPLTTPLAQVSPMSSLFNHIRKEAEKASPFDGLGQFPLLLGGYGSDSTGDDLAALGDKTLQQLDVLVVDLGRIRSRKRARFPPPEEWAARRSAARRSAASLTLHLRLHHRLGDRAIPLCSAFASVARTLAIREASPLTIVSAAAILHHQRRTSHPGLDQNR